jgi:hypothetical protein
MEDQSMAVKRYKMFINIKDTAKTELVLASDYEKLETLCVDFTKAIGEALIARNEQGPDFADGPDFKGYAERSGDGWECKACGQWHPPRTLRCLNNKCPSAAEPK